MKETKKIIYIGNIDFTKSNAALERVLSIVDILIRNNFECIICGFGEESTKLNTLDNYTLFMTKKPNSIFEWIKYLLNSSRFKDLINDGDEVTFILYNLPSLLMISIMLKFKKQSKILSDVTEWYSITGISFFKSLVKKIDIDIRMKLLNKKANGLIVISDLLYNFYSENNTIIIPPLVRCEENLLAKDNLNYIKFNKTNFIYNGFPGYDKDRLDLILDALNIIYIKDPQKFDLINFNIIGIEVDEYKELYPESKYILNNLLNNVTFHGIQSHKYSIEYLNQSDYLFLIRNSSLKNNAGFPMKFSESRVYGTPVIYSEFSDLRKYVNKHDIKIEQMTPDSIADSILKSLSTKSSKEKNQAFCSNHLNYDNIINDFFLKV